MATKVFTDPSFSVGTASGSSTIGYRDLSSFGLAADDTISSLDTSTGSLGSLNLDQAFDDLTAKALEVEADYIQGRIPEDVLEQIKSASGEKALAAGLGDGSGARNLVARDLGLTSLQLQQTGIQLATNTLAQVEQKRQFSAGLQKEIEKFNATYKLSEQQFLTTVRQQDLTEAELRFNVDNQNANRALAVNELITNTALAGQELRVRYAQLQAAGAKVNTSGLKSDIKNIIADLSAILES